VSLRGCNPKQSSKQSLFFNKIIIAVTGFFPCCGFFTSPQPPPKGRGAAVISCDAQLADKEIPQGSPSFGGGWGEVFLKNNYYQFLK
jgi:hypothetical protein